MCTHTYGLGVSTSRSPQVKSPMFFFGRSKITCVKHILSIIDESLDTVVLLFFFYGSRELSTHLAELLIKK